MDTGIFIGDKIITTSWDKIWDKPNTLSGYGITDAVTIDTAQEIYGIKTFKSTTTISTALDVKLILQSLDADNYCMIKVQDQNSQDLSYIGYLGNNWYTDGNLILNSGNYTGELDNRYVNKAGDTMTGDLVFAHTTERPSYSGSIGIAFREQTANGQGIKLVYNDYDDYRIPAGLILVGEQGGEYFEAPAIYQNGHKVWDAGNDGSGSGLDADLLDGKHLCQGQWDSICYIGGDGVLEIGKCIDFHEEQDMSSDFSCRIMVQGDYHNTLHLPTSSGTLATLEDIVAFSTKLQTPRSIYGNPFDGTSDIPVTAIGKMRFLYFTKDDGSELGYIGKGSDHANNLEFINYEGSLVLGANKSDDVIITTNHNVGIGTTNAAHKLHVEGDIYATNGFSETSDIRKKKVLSPHTVDLDDMAYADLFDYTLIDDEKEIVRVGTNAHYWLDKLPQVVTKDNDEYLSLNYGVLGTVCALSVSKYVKQLEDRVTLLENKIASLQ